MLERVANSRTFVSFILAGLSGLILFSAYPFPEGNLQLQYIALKDPLVYSVLARSYTLFLFTTPFLIYSTALSGLYVLSYPCTKALVTAKGKRKGFEAPVKK
jgi:hypothetical protein